MTFQALSHLRLVSAVENNVWALFRTMGRLPGSDFVDTDRLCSHYSPFPSPMFCGAWSTCDCADRVDSRIADVVSLFRSKGAEYFFWWTGTRGSTSHLKAALLDHGFIPDIEAAPLMAAHIDRLAVASRSRSDLVIRIAQSDIELEEWRDAFCAAFGTPKAAGQAWTDATRAGTAAGRPPWTLHVGYFQNQPVATSMVFSEGDVAGVYCIGTVPSARGRGFGAAMTTRPLVHARQKRPAVAVLYSTQAGYSLYRRLGFADLNSTVSRYLWVSD